MALEGTVEKGMFTNPNKFVLMLMCHKKYSNLQRNTICIENCRQKGGGPLALMKEKSDMRT